MNCQPSLTCLGVAGHTVVSLLLSVYPFELPESSPTESANELRNRLHLWELAKHRHGELHVFGELAPYLLQTMG
jgi:hypothetical protein